MKFVSRCFTMEVEMKTFDVTALGEILIDFTEDLAKQINAKTIRFDTHTGNLPAAKLYLKKGYKLIGETPLNLDYDIEDSFKCFEKII